MMLGFTLMRNSRRRNSQRALSLELLETKHLFASDVAACFAMEFAANEPSSALPTLAATPAYLGDGVNEEPAGFTRPDNAGQLKRYIIDAAVEQYRALFGQYASRYHPWNLIDTVYPIIDGPFFSSGRATSIVSFANETRAVDSATGHSATNVQIEGVDEADLVETDGNYLYIMSETELTIVDVRDASNMRVRSRLHLAGASAVHFHQMGEMYLYDNRLTIISRDYGSTLVTIVDVSDRSMPTIVESTRMDGHLASSRAVDDKLYLVLNQTLNLPMVETVHEPMGPWTREWTSSQHFPVHKSSYVSSARPEFHTLIVGTAQFFPMHWNPYSSGTDRYETEAEFRARVAAMPIESLLPGMAAHSVDGKATEFVSHLAATDVYLPTDGKSLRHTTSIASFDVDDAELGPAAMYSLPGLRANEVFMTADQLYLFSAGGFANETGISKFNLDQMTGEISLAATGKVPGSVLNNFSVGEHEDHLQIATTTGWSNNIYVLGQSGNQLNVTGKIEGIAPGEKIYSARFVGDRGFLVTFRKVDPLFTLNLGNPSAPQIVGELHIPGYSDYLQVIDYNHIIGVGRNADESTGLFQELQISLFDVADMSSPKLVDRHSFAGGRNTQSTANFDSHAVGFFDSHDILAIPIHSEGWWQGMVGGVDNTPIFEDSKQSSLPIFQIDVDAGIEPIGEIPFADRVHRSVRIGDVLFAISGQTVKAHAIADPSQQIGTSDYRTAEIDTSIAGATGVTPDDILQQADIDLDGVISPLDALAFVNGLVSDPSDALYDFNNDGQISSVDAEWVIGRIGTRPPSSEVLASSGQ